MPSPPRPQQYRLKWPWTASQVEGLDEMLQTLFKAMASQDDSIVGLTGATGATGSTGAPGAQGPAGATVLGSGGFGMVFDGDDGEMGFPGLTGARGLTGFQGIPGMDGFDSDGGDDPWAFAAAGSPSSLRGLFTAGSVIFAGPGGALAQDNAQLFWDDTNNRLGIGGAPSYKLDVQGTSGTIGIRSGSNTSGDVLFYATGTITGSINMFYSETSATNDVSMKIRNTNAASASASAFTQMSVGGASAGDPYAAWLVSGVQDWSAGIDNSDSDRWKLGPVANPSSGGGLQIAFDLLMNISVGGAASPGTGSLGLFFSDGTAPASLAINTAGLYADDVSGTVQMFAINEAGLTDRLTDALWNDPRTPTTDQTISGNRCAVVDGYYTIASGTSLTLGAGATLRIL